jgi:hypothetical protein
MTIERQTEKHVRSDVELATETEDEAVLPKSGWERSKAEFDIARFYRDRIATEMAQAWQKIAFGGVLLVFAKTANEDILGEPWRSSVLMFVAWLGVIGIYLSVIFGLSYCQFLRREVKRRYPNIYHSTRYFPKSSVDTTHQMLNSVLAFVAAVGIVVAVMNFVQVFGSRLHATPAQQTQQVTP